VLYDNIDYVDFSPRTVV